MSPLVHKPVHKEHAKPRPEPDPPEEEEVKGSPNEKVRAMTGQPSQQAAVPLNQILTPNQTVMTNRSHAAPWSPPVKPY